MSTQPLRHLVDCLDRLRVPLSADERSGREGSVPYWGANGVVDHIDAFLLDEAVILLGEDGAPFFAPDRDVAFLSMGPIWPNNHIHVLRPRGSVDPRFVTYALNATDYGAVISGSTRDKLTQEDMAGIPVPEHPLEEQRRIADFLDDRIGRLERIIASRRRQLVVLEEHFAAERRSLLIDSREAVRPSGLPWAPQLATAWPVRRLAQVASMGTGHTPSRSVPEYWLDCHLPWLTTGDVHRFRRDEIDVIYDTALEISDLGLANSAAVIHPAGTVALSRTASAGFSILMGREMATSQDFVTWTCGPEVLPEYLLQVLRVMRPFLLGYLAMGSTHKTIYFPDLMDLRIPLPDRSTQRTAVEKVKGAAEARRSISRAIGDQLRLLHEYKRSLITAAVAGEIDVTTAGSGIQG